MSQAIPEKMKLRKPKHARSLSSTEQNPAEAEEKNSLLHRRIKKNIPNKALDIFNKFTQEGFEIYLVGGAVRDLLLGKKEIKDLDFTTNATPQQIQMLYSKSFYDNNFGTVRIPSKKGLLEITTYRSEKGYGDFRHPDKITWGKTLEEDLKRRDFTINAMAIGPSGQSKVKSSKLKVKLKLIDNFEGQKDLKNKLIRCVGNADNRLGEDALRILGNADNRLGEDALRILRAIRFATKLEFKIEPKTLTALTKNTSLLANISGERIREELFKILLDKNVDRGFQLMKKAKILNQILPEVTKGYGMKQKGHHLWTVWKHSVLAVKYCPSTDPVVKLAALLHDVGKPIVVKEINGERTFHNHEVVGASIARNIGRRLRLPNKDLDRLTKLVRWHQFSVSEKQTDRAIKRFIRHVGKENIYDMLNLRTGDRLGSGAKLTSWRTEKFKKRLVEAQKQPFTVTDLKINGRDVMKILKIPPGPKVGQILNEVFAKVDNGKLPNERKILLEEIKKRQTSI